MAPLSREEIAETLALLTERQLAMSKEDSLDDALLEKASHIWKILWGVGGVVAAVALWIGKLQWDTADHSQNIARNTLKIEKLIDLQQEAKAQRALDATMIQSIQNTIAANRVERQTEIKSLRSDIDHQQELWDKWLDVIVSMADARERGESNKEYFRRKHGFAAPVGPE